ncbi:peptide chain release factor N(5)-glutamine methyltransferase [Agathobaculum butyriciproducens]|nr:peptide chain release factor N(5)-glutamine methyltransferase [Agathobaculum butyriciproducens]RGC59053.1 peptide chain release factor N(5)-glutamine methyltransferase [Agathobaculum butyriciproducens]
MTKTINDVYMQLFRRLKEGGDPMPQLTAREITAYACKADKKQTAGWSHFYVEDATVDYAGLLCDRCLDGEPLAYIIGEWDFYGLTFKVDRSVLIPRSDTERLCELVIEQAKERVSPRILDLCCGSGCIGIAAAHTVEDARVTAIDLSDGALHITRENARDLGVSSRLLTMKVDVMHAPPRGLGQFDIIVSNPPYVTEDEMQMLDRSVADFEPHEALYGGEDGLDFYHAICDSWGGAASAERQAAVRVRLASGRRRGRHHAAARLQGCHYHRGLQRCPAHRVWHKCSSGCGFNEGCVNRDLLRRIWMKLFLCSHFSSVGSLIKEEIDNKKVAFIPTASLREGYTGYVGSARKLFNKLGATVTEIDISTEAYLTIQSVFEDADVIYFTGGNSFFLMDQLRKTGTDELLKKELAKGKLMIGESAGAIICAPTIQYIEQMDEKPEDYSQEDDAGLDLIDFYVLPHYLTAPFKKVTEKIMTEFSDLNLCPINNRQGIVIDGEGSKVICKD